MILTQALIGDESANLKVMWFNQPYLINYFKKGDWVFFAGKMSQKKSNSYLSNPSYEKLSTAKDIISENQDLTHMGRLIPVYPETEGLSSRWLRFMIKPLLVKLRSSFTDPLPEKLKAKYNLLDFKKAIWQIHFPDSLKLAESAKKRFSFEELLVLSLATLREKLKLAKEKSMPVPVNLDLIKKLVSSLPFELTDDQKKSVWQILKDMEKPKPMNRLLEGDVGSGKTVVAAIAVMNAAKAGFQTAFMAPTEILAKQHFKTINLILEKFDLKIGLIAGKESRLKGKKITRKEMLKKTGEGEIDILIGTHALVQEGVKFKNLALVIIDEQHRFGVDQRAKLCQQKGMVPHLLSMSATPIPRTLSLTVFGDLDLSLIKQMPKGRKKIITEIIPPGEREGTYRFIRDRVKEGKQVFVICPRIEPSVISQDGTDFQNLNRALNWAEVKAVKEEYEKLSKKVFPDLKVAMLHGKMKSEEKEKTMKKFKEGKTDILVSTSVVEVGVDIPNATVMAIEGAEKFGLAQLHQFRGRVGRGEHQSYCFLFTEVSLKRTNQRLKALISCESGFDLAEKDLEIRGPGDFIGQRQWGFPDIIMTGLKNLSLIEETRTAAKEILNEDPELKKHLSLKERVGDFQRRIHLE